MSWLSCHAISHKVKHFSSFLKVLLPQPLESETYWPFIVRHLSESSEAYYTSVSTLLQVFLKWKELFFWIWLSDFPIKELVQSKDLNSGSLLHVDLVLLVSLATYVPVTFQQLIGHKSHTHLSKFTSCIFNEGKRTIPVVWNVTLSWCMDMRRFTMPCMCDGMWLKNRVNSGRRWLLMLHQAML